MPRVWALMLGIGVCVGAVFGYHIPRTPPAATIVRDTLWVRERQLDTVYRIQRQRYDSVVTAYVTVRERDTVMRADTVYVRRDMTDTIVNWCALALTTCEARVANMQAQRDAVQLVAQTEQQRRKWLTYLLPVSFTLGVVLAR